MENENSIILWLTTDSLKERQPSPQNLGPPVSSEGEGSPMIWPISETNDNTEITYNNNLDK